MTGFITIKNFPFVFFNKGLVFKKFIFMHIKFIKQYGFLTENHKKLTKGKDYQAHFYCKKPK